MINGEYSSDDNRRCAAAHAINMIEVEWEKRRHNSTATEMAQMEGAFHIAKQAFRLDTDKLIVALEAQVQNGTKGGDAISRAIFGAAVIAWDIQEMLDKAEKEASEKNEQEQQEQE